MDLDGVKFQEMIQKCNMFADDAVKTVQQRNMVVIMM